MSDKYLGDRIPLLRTGKKFIQDLLAPACLQLAASFPNRLTIAAMCWTNRFLTSAAQVDAIRRNVQSRKSCQLLVFGLGHDSEFYRRINRGGRTAFLENDADWIRLVTKRYPLIEAYRVDYQTRLDEWEKYAANPENYVTKLPAQLDGILWDIIFVDSPLSWLDFHPGRMESIRLASTLIKRPGDIYVHDSERPTIDLFATKFLGAENLRGEVGNLRHYGFSGA